MTGTLGATALPTAQISLAEVAEILERTLPVLLRFGLLTTFHEVPSQCSISVTVAPFEPAWNPTANTLFEASAMTPFSALLLVVGSLGVGTTVHLVPSKCIAMVRKRALHGKVNPTAQTSLLETAATEFSTLPKLPCVQRPGLGLGTVFQLVPSKC